MKYVRHGGHIALLLLSLTWGGCATRPGRPPQSLRELARQQQDSPQEFTPRTIALHNVNRALSRSLSPRERIESLRVVEKLDPAGAEAWSALVQVLGDPATAGPVREAVLAFLARKRTAGLAKYVAAGLPRTTDRGVRLAALQYLEEHPVPEAMVDLVRLWAAQEAPSEEEESCYRRIVEKISGKDCDQALLDAINARGFFARGSALEVLSRRVKPPVMRRRIAAMTPQTDAVSAMQGFVEIFGYVPRTRRELVATVVAHARDRKELIRAARMANRWQAEADYQFNIRDLYLLGRLANDPLEKTGMSRAQLILEISGGIARRRSGPGGTAPPKHGRFRGGRLVDFDNQTESLTMADLWRLLLLNDMFGRRSVQEAFRITALADRDDRRTQWGGLILYSSDRLEAALYPPAERRRDDQYLPSKQFRWDSFDAVCFFVGHFREQAANPDSVAPTAGELALAKSLNACGVVVTSLAGDRLNVTYFNSDGVVIDLGDFGRAA